MKAIVLTVLLWSSAVSPLTSLEMEFITQFLRFLSRSNCAFIDDPNGMRHFTRMFTSSAIVPVRNVPEFLIYQERYTTERIVFVSTGHDLTTYKTVLEEVPNLRVLSRVTWIAVLNVTLDLSVIRVRIPYDSEFFLVEPDGEDALAIREIFSERNVPEIYWNSYGVWSRTDGLTASRLNFFSRRRNLEGYPMTALTLQEECPTTVHCSLREIWFDLARYLNVTTRLSTVEEHRKGDIPWDVNLEPMTYDAYTFTTKAIAPIWKLIVFMHVKHESDLEFSWQSYFSVMWDVFFLYFVVWIACLTLWLTVFEYANSLLHRRGFNATDGIFAGIFWTCNQDGIYLEPNLSLLFVVLMVRIVALAIQIFGTGTLVSSLALRSPYYPFYDLEGFFQDGTYRLGTINGTLSQFYLAHSPVTEERDLSRLMVPAEKAPRTMTEAVDMLCADGKFVVVADNNELMALDEQKCEILRIPLQVAVIFCGIALDDESPFEFVFNSAFNRFLESGVMDRMRRKVYEESDEKENHFHPVAFQQGREEFRAGVPPCTPLYLYSKQREDSNLSNTTAGINVDFITASESVCCTT